MVTAPPQTRFARAAALAELAKTNTLAVQVEGHSLVLFKYGERVYAVDNRCPHMGFPLSKGTVQDGILTCHWHYARFDLASGGTFDQWADDVRSFPVEVHDGDIWVDVAPPQDALAHQRDRLQVGLERNIPLVLAKAAIALMNGGVDPVEAFRVGLDYGVRYRRSGWGSGLTILTCLYKLLPQLRPEDRPRALYHGLSAVANDTDGNAPRFVVRPLPSLGADIPTLKRWFRQFIEVRDDEGAERCIVSAVRAGASMQQMADMLFAAATDHRYIDIGHPLDFTNKAFEALAAVGWQHAETVLTSLVSGYASAARMEESNSWRYPVDLIAILDQAFDAVPETLRTGSAQRGTWNGQAALVPVLLGDDAAAAAAALLDALRAGCTEVQLASAVTYAAALRVARFHTSNEFGDWDTALHTFTFANAVQHGLLRIGTPQDADAYIPLLRGVFDAAMSVYLDRFLNIPAARLPQTNGTADSQEHLLDALADVLNRQQQVNEAGALIAQAAGKDTAPLLAALGGLLLREDRDFHTIQMVEAAVEQHLLLHGTGEGVQVLVAGGRYLAAHAPTLRSEGQTYNIAARLARGEALFADD